jgi:1-acyl-sn-glycerol-3-phosphate acyltransferase
VLLCGNHNSYRDVFLFGMVRSSARLLVHPLVFSFPFLKKYALRWGFVQVSIDDAVALLEQGQPPFPLVRASLQCILCAR